VLVIAPEDPRQDDVRDLLATHLAFAAAHSEPEDVHALDVDELAAPDVLFLAAREDRRLVGVGALKVLDSDHAEIKSMHTSAEARGRGVAADILEELLAHARWEGLRRVSLETGSMEAFEAARRLYERAGFEVCGPFGDYRLREASVFMTLDLGRISEPVRPRGHRDVRRGP
jgi:putative acetyltransferase